MRRLEVDRRFGLKERLSSTLALSTDDADSSAGQALLEDAVHKAERIDIKREIRVSGPLAQLLATRPSHSRIRLGDLCSRCHERKHTSGRLGAERKRNK